MFMVNDIYQTKFEYKNPLTTVVDQLLVVGGFLYLEGKFGYGALP